MWTGQWKIAIKSIVGKKRNEIPNNRIQERLVWFKHFFPGIKEGNEQLQEKLQVFYTWNAGKCIGL